MNANDERTNEYNRLKRQCENPKIVGLADEHTHEVQPYGYVKIVNCRIEIRSVPVFDFNSQRYTGLRSETYVVGTVAESSYCGVLVCGVPMVKPTSDRYPIGSTYECRIRYDSDLQRKRTVDVAM